MDTTKQNILMCEKAVKVQELCENDKLLFNIWWHKKGEFIEQSYLKPCDKYGYHIKSIVWLPRQDKLQRMVENDWEDCLYRFINYVKTNEKNFPIYEINININSMEQLWLAFVMAEKYNKTWNGKEWILQNQ